MAEFDESVDTPSLAEAFRNAFDESMLEVRVALPCKVLEYDAATRTVRVTPLVGRYVRNLEGKETAEELPVINTVPVIFPGGGGAEATFPIQPGDTGELSFHDSSLDEWKAADNQPVIARDIRSHALTDATFRPGLRSPGGPGNAPRTDAAVFGYATAESGGTVAVHVTPTGIGLGEANPPDAAIKGTTYRTAEDTLLDALTAYLSNIIAAIPNGGTATAGATLTWNAAVVAFKSGPHLSTTVKVKG